MRVTLDIDTGAGNHPTIAQIGDYRPSYGEFYKIVGLQPIEAYQDRFAQDVAKDFDNAIEAMHDNVVQFGSLPEPVRREYDRALSFLITWRNECKLHPLAQITVPVQAAPI
jgi:hypothetical protein